MSPKGTKRPQKMRIVRPPGAVKGQGEGPIKIDPTPRKAVTTIGRVRGSQTPEGQRGVSPHSFWRSWISTRLSIAATNRERGKPNCGLTFRSLVDLLKKNNRTKNTSNKLNIQAQLKVKKDPSAYLSRKKKGNGLFDKERRFRSTAVASKYMTIK